MYSAPGTDVLHRIHHTPARATAAHTLAPLSSQSLRTRANVNDPAPDRAPSAPPYIPEVSLGVERWRYPIFCLHRLFCHSKRRRWRGLFCDAVPLTLWIAISLTLIYPNSDSFSPIRMLYAIVAEMLLRSSIFLQHIRELGFPRWRP